MLACVFAGIASACAMIAGLDDPSVDPSDASPGDDGSTPIDGAVDDGSTDAGPGADADAGRRCTGTPLKSDSFDDRTNDAAAGWAKDYQGDGGVVDIVDGGLHIDLVPATSKVNIHRQLEVTKTGAKRMCVSFSVMVAKPTPATLSSYFDAGDTTFGFIATEAADASMYTGVGIDTQGVIAYVFRDVGGETRRHLALPLGANPKWRVLVDADFVANQAFVVVNDKEEKLSPIRTVDAGGAPTAFFALGIRNLGPTPEAEAYFDDVIVTAD